MAQLFIVVRHDSQFERIHEVITSETLIGRDHSCELRFEDLSVSRKHALLLLKKGDLYVRDLGSRNGTYVDGMRVKDESSLRDGVVVRIGAYHLTICVEVGKAIRDAVDLSDTTAITGNPTPPGENATSPAKKLTPAQERVYHGFILGLSEKEIATKLGISINTVHDHSKAIYKSLEVSSRGELMSQAMQRQRNGDSEQ